MRWLDSMLALVSPGASLRRATRLAERGRMAQAFRAYARAAAAGLAEAQFHVGRCYLEGSGVPASPAEGTRWLERAAKQGFVEAQAQLAGLYVQGAGTAAAAELRPGGSLFSAVEPHEPDFATAAAWARKAAEGGSADGQSMLAYILTSGPETMRDPEEAHRWYERFRRGRLAARGPRLCSLAGTPSRDRGRTTRGRGSASPRGRCRAGHGVLSARRAHRAGGGHRARSGRGRAVVPSIRRDGVSQRTGALGIGAHRRSGRAAESVRRRVMVETGGAGR